MPPLMAGVRRKRKIKMNELLPDILKQYIKPLAADRSDPGIVKIIEKFTDLYGEDYINSQILTQHDAKGALNKLGINEATSFYSFYLHSFEPPETYRSEDIFGLIEILGAKREAFESELPNNFLRISSIEGEFSLFYDINKDDVYGVDWSESKDFIEGRLTPKFNSFFEFLNWYYSNAEE